MNTPPSKPNIDPAKTEDDKARPQPRYPATPASRPIVGGNDPVKTEDEVDRPIPLFLRIKPDKQEPD